MTNIIFSRIEFEQHVKITPEIEEKITLFGTPLESISKENIEIEIFPNRPDLISLQGFMRSFKKFLGKKPGIEKYDLKKPENDLKVYIDSSVNNIRPFLACALIKKVNLTDEKLKDLINLQEKLAITLGRNRKKMAVGIYPSVKLDFPLKYIAKKPQEIKFKPLGSNNELNVEDILIMNPTARKYKHLIKDFEKYPIIIDSKGNILSMPPIINSEESGRLDIETKDLFIECTGTDKSTVEKTLIIIATSLADLGGTIQQIEVISDKEKNIFPKLTNQKVKFSIENTNKLLGLSLNESQISKLLEKMGHEFKKNIVEVAPWRVDILHEVDLIEDVAIAYGYNNLNAEIPNISTSGEESKQSIVKRKLSEVLIGLGLLEISTYHLIKQKEVEDHNLKNCLELLDSKNEYKYLRPNLIIPMLRVMSENKDVQYPQKLFEIGRVFNKNSSKENGIAEDDKIIISLSPSNATEIKKHLDYLFKMINIEYQIKEKIIYPLIEGRTCSILVNNKEIGYLGDVHPSILKKEGINMPMSIAEIYLTDIYELIN